MPRLRHGHAVALALIATLATASSAVAQAASPPGEPITAERLLKPREGDWLNYRRTYDVTGYSPLQEIHRGNVQYLRPVWAYSFRDGSRWSPTPIVTNGLMYVAEGSGRVTALDALTGNEVWAYDRSFPEDIGVSMAYPRSRGVAVYGERVYWGTPDAHLVALDARTGDVVWDVQTGNYKDGHGHSHAPTIIEGKVILGFSGSDYSARGKIVAHDAETGEHLWTTYTVPAAGEPGYETWGNAEKSGVPPLGAAPWGTPSYDPQLRLLYMGTGQPTPRNRLIRGAGDALYSSSILAMEIDTGKIRWYHQVLPGESWDYDTAHESMLLDMNVRGRPRRVLLQTSKIGWGVVLDRMTGEFLQAFRTGYDNVVTGWTETGRPLYNPEAVPGPEDLDSGKVFHVCPHLHGTRDLHTPSFSPLTRLYYLGINNSCQEVTYFTEEFGRRYQGMSSRPTLAPGYDYIGEFVAFDPETGRRVWEYRPEGGAPMTASALSTAGGIVFGGTADRQFFALNTETGELLWNTRLNGDISGAPVTYTVDGKQYVAVAAGGRIAQTTTLGPLLGLDIPRGSGVMWVFALPDPAPRQ